MRLRPLGPALVVALSFANPAAAEDKEPSPPPGPFKVGPVYLTPRLELRSAGSDSNVYNAPTAAVSDATFVLAPGLEVAAPVGRHLTLSARGLITYNWYDDEDTERSADRGLLLRAETHFDRFDLFAETGWSRAKQRYSLDLDERLVHDDDLTGFGGSLRLARKLKLGASWRKTRFDIQGPVEVEESLDHDSETLTGDASYELTPRTTLQFRAERIVDSFDESLGSDSREARSGRYMGGFSFSTRAAISGQLLAGVRTFPSGADQAAPAYTGPALDVSLGIPAGRVGRFHLRAEREVQYSATPGVEDGETVRNSYVFSRYEIQLQSELPYDLIARGTLGWQSGVYQVPYEVDGVLVDRDATLHLYGVSLLKAIGESFRIGGGITWERRESTLPGDDYHGSRYGIQAEYAP